MKNRFLISFITAALLLSSVTSDACTTILVGKEQTDDGSYLVGRNEDYHAYSAKLFARHPHQKNKGGEFKSVTGNEFTYPEPAEALSYTSVSDFDTEHKSMGAAGFNELGVGISASESIFNRDKALAVDPYDEEKGITEDAIYNLIVSRAKSAKEGVQLLGDIIEERGAGEGFGVAFVDAAGVWYLETASGHHWMAAKLPNDKYFVSANRGRLRDYNPTDSENYLGSADLVEFAVANDLYDPQDGSFDFSKAYVENLDIDGRYNFPRVWRVQSLLNPSRHDTPGNGLEHPVYLTAEKKISLATVKSLLRDHYEGLSQDHYSNEGSDFWRPISVFRTLESHVLQVRPNLPGEIGNVTYIALGSPALSVYLPYYQGIETFPEAYTVGSDKASEDSAYWKYRKLQTLVMTDYPSYAPIVKKAYADFEEQTALKQAKMEKKYLELHKNSPQEATVLLQSFENEILQEALNLTTDLTNEVFTRLTNDLENKFKPYDDGRG